MTLRVSAFLAMLAFSAPGWAAPPDSCAVVKVDEINSIAGGAVEKVQPLKSGNPSECNFLDKRRGAVLVISIREVQYAAENELQHDRENLEKIYRGKVKWLAGVGENGFWMPVNKQLVFRKAKTLVSVKFSRAANQNEVDSSQVARLIDSRLP
jgi:hypothetical protein